MKASHLNRQRSFVFTGPDETAKLAAAKALSTQLGLKLHRIDLSSVVSKYIRETEKNLEKIFRVAEQKNWLLFFDEADALFGKRTGVRDSHDRYANQEVSYLVQRLKTFPGIAVIAVNRKGPLSKMWKTKFTKVVGFSKVRQPASSKKLEQAQIRKGPTSRR
jgi:SpoVK/Ycf46/Vps4 family AAA+-type ATPase